MIVDCAVYTKGVRREGQVPVELALEAAREPDSFVWIGLFEPTPSEFYAVRQEFELHELAVEDAVKAHQRPKLELYGDNVFVVLKTARYIDVFETVEFAEIQLFVGRDYVVSVRHGKGSALSDVREHLEQDPELLRHGPAAVLHAVVDRVVDDYEPVIRGLDNDIREIEVDVFDADRAHRVDPSRRIFKLKREVLDFHRHAKPLSEVLGRLHAGLIPHCDGELREYFRDVQDHLLRVVSEIENFRDLLADVLGANLAQVSVRQNDDMRKISAWLAIGGFPTVMGAIYGMNFEHMPELDSQLGYPAVLLLCVAVCVALHRNFKRAGWL
ncbi:MAG: magnesium and cobalt transport protein CorA [Acidimicrobiia bacterium]|nr:magnesium and cobalt transport protein CorA [Acidimicrobiia bacterium]